jgi:uncharacterized membrane protein
MSKSTYKHLLDIENEQLRKLNDIVLTAIDEEKLISKQLIVVEEPSTFGGKLADKVASFGGSWRFIMLFTSILVVWIVLNAFWLHNTGFDPYPFILLNLILSCIAALQAPIIMMSQNRQAQKDRKQAENDYLINLKTEIELRNLHQKIDLLMVEQMKTLFEIQKEQLEVLERIENRQAK